MSDTLNRVDAVALVLADFFHGSTDVTNGGVLAAARLAVDAADAAVNREAAWAAYYEECERSDVQDGSVHPDIDRIVFAALGRQSNE